MDDEAQQVLKLELTVVEINTILRSLGKHPFDEISELIKNIKEQGESQLAEAAKAGGSNPAE
jgi:hypothetical protein